MYSVQEEQFEGPLDLLLTLIEQEKLDITQISLAKITNSYLNKIADLKGNSADIADFLLIAAKLLYIKSKELIPSAENDEEEAEIIELEDRLREYQAYKQAAKHLDTMLSELNRSYGKRGKPKLEVVFTPPKDIDGASLYAIFCEILSKASEDTPEISEIKTDKKVTLQEKRADILNQLKNNKKTSFKKIMKGSHSKVDVIVTFLAILEMIKQKEIKVIQSKNFDDFELHHNQPKTTIPA